MTCHDIEHPVKGCLSFANAFCHNAAMAITYVGPNIISPAISIWLSLAVSKGIVSEVEVNKQFIGSASAFLETHKMDMRGKYQETCTG